MMRRMIFGLLLCLTVFANLCAGAGRPSPITSLRIIHQLTNEQADKALPVAFEANVTYYGRGNVDLFAQDGDVAIYVEVAANEDVTLGDRVLITGFTRSSFRPEIKSTHITVLHHDLPPPAVSATFPQLIHAEFDCRRVTIRAKVRSANTILDIGSPSTYLQLL